jgi:hypothetical protein
MFGLQTLDIAVGLVFIYFVLSIICTAANEMIASWLKLRADSLEEGIRNLLKDPQKPELAGKFLDHPLIKSLCRGDKKPSYIPPRTFALTLLDVIAPAKIDGSRYFSDILNAVSQLPEKSDIRNTLLIFLDDAQSDLQKLRANIETWFNDAMDRVSGWYKRKAQLIIFIIAALVAGASNADTIQIVKTLSLDPALREGMAKRAIEVVNQQSTVNPAQPVQGSKDSQTVPAAKELAAQDKPQSGQTEAPKEKFQKAWKDLEAIQASGIPLGWTAAPKPDEWASKIIGLVLTIFAVSLGAPFWFDLLSKIVSLRSAGVSPVEKEEKALKLQKEGTPK